MADQLLVLGDLHAPYHHRDAFAFMQALRDEFEPDEVVHIGDEIDWASQNYHEKVPGIPNPVEEFRLVRKEMAKLHDLFPEMVVIHSNHGNLPSRKAQTIGFPPEFLRSKNDLYGLPDDWEHRFDYTVKLPKGESVYICHGRTGNVVNLSKNIGNNAIQGHYHSKMGVTFYGTPERLMWGAQTGCLVDKDSLAMAYGKNSAALPLLGSLVVLDGVPIVIPMRLKKSGRWDGRI